MFQLMNEKKIHLYFKAKQNKKKGNKRKSLLVLNCYSNYKLWCSVNFFPWHYYEPHFLTKSRINNSNIFCFNYQGLMGHNKTKLSGAEKK